MNSVSLPGLLDPVNQWLEPGVRLGLANPLPLTSGLVILEVAGRRSGTIRSVPLLATDYGRALVVSTVRSNSQWLKNLVAAGDAAVWLRGCRRNVQAFVYRGGQRLSEAAPGRGWEALARGLSGLTGTSVAVLALAKG